MPTGCPTKTRF